MIQFQGATVYRNLPLLVESGIIRKIDIGHDNKFYALNGRSETFKAQVICSNCRKIFDIDAPFMEWYGKNVSEKLGLDVKDQRLQVHAECPDFRKTGKCKKKVLKHDRNRKKFDLKVFRHPERPPTLSFEQKRNLKTKRRKKRCHPLS